MAKKVITKVEANVDNDIGYLDRIIQEQFENIQDLSKQDTKIKFWYDIGVYALNYAMAKRLKAGLPAGRVTGFDGLSSTGKSLLVASAAKDPQIQMIIIIETEGGGNSKELLQFAGVDLSKVRILKHDTFTCYRISKKNTNKIEEISDDKFPIATNTDEWLYKEGMNRALKRFVYNIEMSGRDPKILIILDSLGNIQSVREKQGISDVGAKNKDIAAFFRTFDNAFERTNIAFLFTNKVYTNFMDPYNPVKETGGVNVMFNSSLYIRLTTMSENEDISDGDLKEEKEKRTTSLGSSFKSVRAKIHKSRFGTEFRNAWFLIDMSMGPNKFSGLFTLLKDFGILKRNGSSYIINGWNNDKSFFKKDFISLLIKNEEESINTFQRLLDEVEEIIKEKRKSIYANDITEILETNDPVISGVIIENDDFSEFDSSEMNMNMERDIES